MKRGDNIPKISFQQVDCKIDEGRILCDLAEIILLALETEGSDESLQNQGDLKEMNELQQMPKQSGSPGERCIA